jgi:hypothetical protein
VPENFASLLEALNDEGRTLARTAPAGVIESLGKARRRRHRFTAATSAVAVCALAAGVAFGVGGGAGSRQRPITPGATPSTSSSATPSPSLSAHSTVTTKNRTGLDALMKPTELPQPAFFQWSDGETHSDSTGGDSVPYSCGSEPTLKNFASVHSRGRDRAAYISAADESSSWEMIYHYSSAAGARADYDLLKPDPSTCPSAHVTATVTDGSAWEDGVSGTTSIHKMIVLSNSDVAYWFYNYQDSGKPYDTSDDQAALQRMADRLDGGQPVPDPVTAPPANAIPASAWLDPSQIPFATADESHGWVPFGGQQQSTSSSPSAFLCKSVTDGEDFVALPNAVVTTRSYHGSPSTTPVYPGSNYLYSGADEHIVSFDGSTQDAPTVAKTAFVWSRQILVDHGCQFKDGSGAQVTRQIKIAVQTDTGFSLLATDTPGTTSYTHLYCVIKGSHVAWMTIGFEQGDTSTDGDAAILASMAARLP